MGGIKINRAAVDSTDIRIMSPNKTTQHNSNFASSIDAICPSGTGSTLPKNNIKNEINVSGDVNKLHVSNHQQQIENITQLLISSDSHITHEMVAKALNAGGHGCTLQQEINHRPEIALVVLTLFEPQEIPKELLSAAVKLVNSINAKDLDKEKNIKSILNGQQQNVDKHLAKFLSTRGDNILKNLATFYQEKYVSPAIKEKIEPYFDDIEIKNLSVDKVLVSEANKKLDNDVSKLITEYNKIDDGQYGDKYQQLNNIFRSIEQKIEIIRPLKVKMNLTEPVKQKIPENKSSIDEVDGLASQPDTNSSRNISNSYNTTIVNNYASSPLSANTEHVSYQEHDNKVDQEFSSPNTHENDKPLDDQVLSSLSGFQSPKAVLHKLVEEPSPDYDPLNNNAQNEQEIATVESELAIEPSHEDPSVAKEKKLLKSIEDRFKSSVKVAEENNQPIDIKPKFGSHYGSYLIDKKVPEGVKLTNNREPVQDKSTKPAEAESFMAIKNASHYRTSYIDGNNKVVLSAEGLMTRNLNEKLDYAKQS